MLQNSMEYWEYVYDIELPLNREMAFTIFQTIRERLIHKSVLELGPENQYPHHVDARELKQQLSPKSRGYPLDWMTSGLVAPCLKALEASDLIIKSKKTHPPYGWGSEYLFQITAKGKHLIMASKNKKHLKKTIMSRL